MNKFDLAEAFIAIADVGSIKQAAVKLHQTDAAVSKKLSKLEDALSTRLLKRTRKGIILTEVGQQYYHQAKSAVLQLREAELAINAQNTRPAGKLRIVASYFHAEKWLLPSLANFIDKYPDIRLTLDIAEVLPDFNARHMDILFGVSWLGDDNLVQKKIDQTRYVLCASPQYLKKHTTPKTAAELLHHDFICHSSRKTPNIIRFDDEQQIIIKPKLLCNNTSLIIQAALAGHGIFWTHENIIAEYLQDKRLISILDKQFQKKLTVYAFYLYQTYSDPKIKAFVEFFCKNKTA